MKKSFSDKLTPEQIRLIFDELDLNWREHYNPDNDGWVNLHAEMYHFNADLSVNIYHGGFVDQYSAGHPDPEIDGVPVRGDIVTLVSWLCYESRDPLKGIEWIKRTLGINEGVKPPELKNGALFANEWLDKDSGNKFVRMPCDILHSKLKHTTKLVWMEIFDRVGKEEIYSFAGVRNIAKNLSMGKSTVQNCLDELSNAGLLIQKPARVGQKFIRYPLVSSKYEIDARLKGKSATVPKMNTMCVQNEYTGVFIINTELEPVNYTQLTIPKKLISANQDYAPSFFYSYQQRQHNINEVNKNGYNPYTGEIFDERGYPSDWDFDLN